MPLHVRSTLAAATLAVLVASCQDTGTPSLDPMAQPVTEQEQASKIAAAKAAAREGVIADIYAEWQAAFRAHEGALEQAEAERAAGAASSDSHPVRSLEELMRQTDPAAHDPALRGLVQAWADECADYDRRLRELGNDPTADPRSPVVRPVSDEG